MTNDRMWWVHLPKEILQYQLSLDDFVHFRRNDLFLNIYEGLSFLEKAQKKVGIYISPWSDNTLGNIVNFHWELTRTVSGVPERVITSTGPNDTIIDPELVDYAKNCQLLEHIANISAESCGLQRESLKKRQIIDFYIDVPSKEPEGKFLFMDLGFAYRIRLYFNEKDELYSIRNLVIPYNGVGRNSSSDRSGAAKMWYYTQQSKKENHIDNNLEMNGFRDEIIYAQRADKTNKNGSRELDYFWGSLVSKLVADEAVVRMVVLKDRLYWSPLPWDHTGTNPFSDEETKNRAPILTMIESWGRVINDLCYIYGYGCLSLSEFKKHIGPHRTFSEMREYVQSLDWPERANRNGTITSYPLIRLQQEIETSYHSEAIPVMYQAASNIEKAFIDNNIQYALSLCRKADYGL